MIASADAGRMTYLYLSLAIVAEVVVIDNMLKAYRTPPPTPAFLRGVIASAPAMAPPLSRTQLWWSGLGLATACLAGTIAGAAIVTALSPAA